MRRVAVIGGAGFLGSHLVERLLADDVAVDVVDDLSSGSLANLADARTMGRDLKIHHLDAGSAEGASLLGMRRPDVVYHLAAVPARHATTDVVARAVATTLHVVDAVREHRIPKVVVAIPATVIYGRPPARDLPLKERPIEPRGVRGVVARATVDLLELAREQDAIEFTALALTTVYGPRRREGVVARLVDAANERRPPFVSGDGRQTRDLLFVDDAVDALVRAGTRGSGLVINVGTGQQTSIRELWGAIGGPAGHEPTPVAAELDELHRFAVSPVRARIHLSWSPWTSVTEGLAQLR